MLSRRTAGGLKALRCGETPKHDTCMAGRLKYIFGILFTAISNSAISI